MSFGQALIELDKVLKESGVALSESEKQLLTQVSNPTEAYANVAASILASRIIEHAVSVHAAALKKAADSSDKYARRLSWATWALAATTAVLVIVTLVR